jgi:hypothetical protein
MSGATTTPDEVGEYLGAVRAALDDLPAEERDDLLVEVEASIAEVAAESDSAVTARLGPPEEFAAELREAAGFRGASPQHAEPGSLRALTNRAALHPALRRIRSLANELAPIWWVARGYAAVGILGVWLQTGWAERNPFVPRFDDSAPLGVASVAPGVAASVAIGRRQLLSSIRQRPGWHETGSPSRTSTRTLETGRFCTTCCCTTRKARRSRWTEIRLKIQIAGLCEGKVAFFF